MLAPFGSCLCIVVFSQLCCLTMWGSEKRSETTKYDEKIRINNKGRLRRGSTILARGFQARKKTEIPFWSESWILIFLFRIEWDPPVMHSSSIEKDAFTLNAFCAYLIASPINAGMTTWTMKKATNYFLPPPLLIGYWSSYWPNKLIPLTCFSPDGGCILAPCFLQR